MSPKCCCHLSQQKTALFSLSYLLALSGLRIPLGLTIWPLLGSSMEEGLGWSSSPCQGSITPCLNVQQYQGHKGTLSRQAQQGDDKEVCLSQACSTAKASNKMQDHKYAFAHERKGKGPSGSWVLLQVLPLLCIVYHSNQGVKRYWKKDASSSPARRGGTPLHF